jgi:hypothetical protein
MLHRVAIRLAMCLARSVEQIIVKSLGAVGAALNVLHHLNPELDDSDGTSIP